MSKFEEFKEKFESLYEDIDDFIEKELEYTTGSNLMKLKQIADNDNINYDSYGNNDSTLERIVYFEDYGIYVKFEGTSQSYVGQEWKSMKEVKPVEQVVTNFEEIKE
jgi:hypothetical protein